MKPRLVRTAALVLLAVTIACDRTAVAPSSTASVPAAVASIAIEGPGVLAPGEAARFTAIATLTDHTTQDYTQKVSWMTSPRDVIAIGQNTGEATALTSGDASVWASLQSFCCNSARIAVLVVPRNTYRLAGRVQESALPVQGATVTVLSGVGSGQSAATDYDGQYRLYGVAGAVQIRVTKPGYVDLVKNFTASQNDVLDFPEARQTTALPAIAGSYVLTLQPDGGCAVASDPHIRILPADMLQARSYAVQMTQEGPALHVAGTGASFVAPSDRFDGRITPDGVEFQFGNGYLGYGPEDAFTSFLSPTLAISYEGTVYAVRAGSTISGRLDGMIEAIEKTPASQVRGQCRAATHRFSMSPVTGATR